MGGAPIGSPVAMRRSGGKSPWPCGRGADGAETLGRDDDCGRAVRVGSDTGGGRRVGSYGLPGTGPDIRGDPAPGTRGFPPCDGSSPELSTPGAGRAASGATSRGGRAACECSPAGERGRAAFIRGAQSSCGPGRFFMRASLHTSQYHAGALVCSQSFELITLPQEPWLPALSPRSHLVASRCHLGRPARSPTTPNEYIRMCWARVPGRRTHLRERSPDASCAMRKGTGCGQACATIYCSYV
jgi:hypothetical protein